MIYASTQSDDYLWYLFYFIATGLTQCRTNLEEADDTVTEVGFARTTLVLRDACLNRLGRGCSFVVPNFACKIKQKTKTPENKLLPHFQWSKEKY